MFFTYIIWYCESDCTLDLPIFYSFNSHFSLEILNINCYLSSYVKNVIGIYCITLYYICASIFLKLSFVHKSDRRLKLFQAMVYLISLVAILVSLIAFSVTRHNIYLYMGLSSVLLIAIYTGYFRRRIRKQFNIRGTDSSLDDCVLHLICPCCTLCQEARTLEINNVQCGVWHGRGDTICLGSNGEGNKAFAALHKSSFVPIKSPELCGMDRTSNGANEHEPLVPSDLPEQ